MRLGPDHQTGRGSSITAGVVTALAFGGPREVAPRLLIFDLMLLVIVIGRIVKQRDALAPPLTPAATTADQVGPAAVQFLILVRSLAPGRARGRSAVARRATSLE